MSFLVSRLPVFDASKTRDAIKTLSQISNNFYKKTLDSASETSD